MIKWIMNTMGLKTKAQIEREAEIGKLDEEIARLDADTLFMNIEIKRKRIEEKIEQEAEKLRTNGVKISAKDGSTIEFTDVRRVQDEGEELIIGFNNGDVTKVKQDYINVYEFRVAIIDETETKENDEQD